MAEYKLRIGITQGDINGVGWETIIKVFQNSEMTELFTPVIYGNSNVASFYTKTIEEATPVQFNICRSVDDVLRDRINLVQIGENVTVNPGRLTADGSKAALDSLNAACADLKNRKIDALVTSPICKKGMQQIGFEHTGHTEYLEAQLGGKAMMLMCSDVMRVALQTIHMPMDQVARSIDKDSIVSSLEALRMTLKQDFGVVEPKIAVLSLNPHAGDDGMLGIEETNVIKPAILEAYGKGIYAFGPVAADGFFASGAYSKYDGILAMYHDQGLTPFKTLTPDGVNYTAGLEEVRTSPDHGVAYDIAGKGIANESSLRNAIFMAIDIKRRRNAYQRWSSHPLERFEREKGRDISVKDLPGVDAEE